MVVCGTGAVTGIGVTETVVVSAGMVVYTLVLMHLVVSVQGISTVTVTSSVETGTGTGTVVSEGRVLVVRTLVLRHLVASVQGTSMVMVISVVTGVGASSVELRQGDVV